MKRITPPITIEIQYDDHDITLTDFYHEDNFITMTRKETAWVVEKLTLLLNEK